jgi:hypothetical protein
MSDNKAKRDAEATPQVPEEALEKVNGGLSFTIKVSKASPSLS